MNSRCTAALAVIAGCGLSAHAQTLIDNFELPETRIGTDSGADFGPFTPTGATSAFDERRIGAGLRSGTGNVELISDAMGNGVMHHRADPTAAGYGFFNWRSGLVDLTDGGTMTGIQIRVLSNEVALRLYFFATDVDDNYGEGGLNIPGGIASPTDFFFPFADLMNFQGIVDFSRMELLQLEINSGGIAAVPGTDLQLDFIQSNTPAPASAALLALGGLCATRRRR
ncbi:MAG: hypothetical protein ACF8SC_09955 [Phycisphaerales bacterium JB037]